MEILQSADFWIGLVKIIWINIILSGDNAVVIALAARSLPPAQQKKAILFGSGAAVVLRIVLTVVAAKLLALPYLQIIGGLLLLWIGVQLLGDEDEGEGEGKEYGTMMASLASAVSAPPEISAPAWPMRLPGGAVTPAMKPTIGFFMWSLHQRAASASSGPPISPIMITASVSGSSLKAFITSMCFRPLIGSPPIPTALDWPKPTSVNIATAS